MVGVSVYLSVGLSVHWTQLRALEKLADAAEMLFVVVACVGQGAMYSLKGKGKAV